MIHTICQLSAQTSLDLTLAAAGALVAGVIVATWRAANFLRDVRDELKGLRSDVKESWTRREQERWAFELERRNRELPLDVPSVSPKTDEVKP